MALSKRVSPWILAGVAIVWLAVHLFGLARLPLPNCDEAWYASTAYQFLTQGSFGLPIVNNVVGLGEAHPVFGRFYLAGLAGMFALFGPGYFQARLFSLVGIIALVAAVYFTTGRLYDRRAALIAALLTAFSWDVMVRGHNVRPEIWLAAATVAVLGLFAWYVDRPTFGGGVVFGLAAALPLNLHPNAILFLAGFGVLCLIEIGLRQRKLAALAGAGIGALAGGGVWWLLSGAAFIHALGPGEWISLGNSPVQASVGALLAAQGRWLVEHYWMAYGRGAMLQAVYFLAALAAALLRRGRHDLWLALLIVVSMVGYTFLKVGKLPPPSVLWVPLLLILLAGSLDGISDWLGSRGEQTTRHSGRKTSPTRGPLGLSPSPLHRWRGDRPSATTIGRREVRGEVKGSRLPLPDGLALTPFMVALPLLAAYLAGTLWLTYGARSVSYAQEIDSFEALIPPGATVAGEATWWFGLGAGDRPFLDDYYFDILANANAASGGTMLDEDDIGAAFESIGIDYVVLDGATGCTDTPSPAYAVYSAYVTATCEPVGEVQTASYYGPQQELIYHCP
jgi:4-amino-4-deoxy-L-arabinose transferase-like glycosyltransferase